MAIGNKYKIIAMISLLILLPILLSVLVTQYETCRFIKHNCTSSASPHDYVKPIELNQFLDEAVCVDNKPDAPERVYKDSNTGKCYTFVEKLGSSPPPPDAKLVWIGRGADKNKNFGNQDYKEFRVSSTQGWQDTGLWVQEGDEIEITANGSIRFDSSGILATPDGVSSGEQRTVAPEWTCTYLICGKEIKAKTLVGRIGDDDLTDYANGFIIGSKFKMTAPKSGNLLLGFNDGIVEPDRTGLHSGAVSDNNGSFSAQIRII